MNTLNLERTLTSNEVSKMIGKEHSKLMRDIRTYITYLDEAKIGSVDFFIDSTYQDSKNETRPNYLLTKQGCEMVSNKLTGAKGVQFTAMYVSRFNKMEEDLKAIPTSPRELAKLALAANEEVNERVDKIDTRLTEIEENKPINTEDYGTIGRNVSKKVHKIISERHLEVEARKLLFKDLNSSIKQVFNVPNRGRIKDKDFEKVLDFIRGWEPSSVTNAKLKEL
ncbi:antirepressor [Floricoccus penangensis]|uniref:Antirepressor n=1 Tax=Floricoccus penangensis TaxID=1859475 RepID=A0A9Q5JG48_9LACT|nr:Rha family transcriptional regulator [Floricoccus penangensis]OFI46723.1 antirepressor [Floricoccus penangensis]